MDRGNDRREQNTRHTIVATHQPHERERTPSDEICFYWYHRGECRRRPGKRPCPFRHALEEGAVVHFNPQWFRHEVWRNHQCTLPLCPLAQSSREDSAVVVPQPSAKALRYRRMRQRRAERKAAERVAKGARVPARRNRNALISLRGHGNGSESPERVETPSTPESGEYFSDELPPEEEEWFLEGFPEYDVGCQPGDVMELVVPGPL